MPIRFSLTVLSLLVATAAVCSRSALAATYVASQANSIANGLCPGAVVNWTYGGGGGAPLPATVSMSSANTPSDCLEVKDLANIASIPTDAVISSVTVSLTLHGNNKVNLNVVGLISRNLRQTGVQQVGTALGNSPQDYQVPSAGSGNGGFWQVDVSDRAVVPFDRTFGFFFDLTHGTGGSGTLAGFSNFSVTIDYTLPTTGVSTGSATGVVDSTTGVGASVSTTAVATNASSTGVVSTTGTGASGTTAASSTSGATDVSSLSSSSSSSSLDSTSSSPTSSATSSSTADNAGADSPPAESSSDSLLLYILIAVGAVCVLVVLAFVGLKLKSQGHGDEDGAELGQNVGKSDPDDWSSSSSAAEQKSAEPASAQSENDMDASNSSGAFDV